MPRFRSRNAVVALNLILLTALFLHLKYELWDKPWNGDESANVPTSHIPDELLDDPDYQRATATPYPGENQPSQESGKTLPKSRKTAVVVASQSSENATWLEAHFPEWEKYIYHVDDPKAELTVPKNKGRESMVYLTYV